MKDLAAIRAVDSRRYLIALMRSGWAWLLAAAIVLGNDVALAIGVAAGEESPVFLITCVVLLGLACWLFCRAHQLALRDVAKDVVPPPQA